MEPHLEQREREYIRAFTAYTLFSDEKKSLYERIALTVERAGALSLFDIGPGGGELAIPLSSLVDRYCAIEQNPSYARSLRALDLAVLEGRFPVLAEELDQCDVVLISHALPRHPAEYEPFLAKAWECVARGGVLVVIVHKDVPSAWKDFLVACDLSAPSPDIARTERLKEHVSLLGETEIDTLTTFVSTFSLKGMLSALSFVYASGQPKKTAEFETRSSAIVRYLKTHHYGGSGKEYRFPFQHLFVEVWKG